MNAETDGRYLYCSFCGEKLEFRRVLGILSVGGFEELELWDCPGCQAQVRCTKVERLWHNQHKLRKYNPKGRQT